MGLGTKTFSSEKGVPQLIADLESLIINDDSGDLTCYVGTSSTSIKCHTFLMSIRCKSFNPENVRFPDVSPDVFRIFLQYVYTGKVN